MILLTLFFPISKELKKCFYSFENIAFIFYCSLQSFVWKPWLYGRDIDNRRYAGYNRGAEILQPEHTTDGTQ